MPVRLIRHGSVTSLLAVPDFGRCLLANRGDTIQVSPKREAVRTTSAQVRLAQPPKTR